jgi:hypothetical protein
MLAIANDTFDPVLLSLPENRFLLEHVGKPPAVVSRIPLPEGVNPKAVMPVIETIYALEEVEKHDKAPWAGVDLIKRQITTYLDQCESWKQMKRRNGPKWPAWPSMAAWDAKGKPVMGATGSDAGRVRSYFDENGDRQRFAVSLHDQESPAFLPPWIKTTPNYDALVTDDAKGFLRCPICEHTETYNPEAQSARNAATGRMAKHLVSAKERVESHRELHTKVYGR